MAYRFFPVLIENLVQMFRVQVGIGMSAYQKSRGFSRHTVKLSFVYGGGWEEE